MGTYSFLFYLSVPFLGQSPFRFEPFLAQKPSEVLIILPTNKWQKDYLPTIKIILGLTIQEINILGPFFAIFLDFLAFFKKLARDMQ